MFLQVLLLSALMLAHSGLAHAADDARGNPVAVLFGENVYAKDLVAPAAAG